MSNQGKWAVIENAGYHGERLVRRFPTSGLAWAFLARQYDEEDRERLHPDIAHWDEAGEFWSYDH